MKVSVVHERFPPDTVGGGEVLVGKTVEHLIKRGHEVTVITTGKHMNDEPYIKRLRVHRYLFNFMFPFVIRHSKGSDIIHCHTFNSTIPSLLAARILRKPVLCTVLGSYGRKWDIIKGRVLGPLFRIVERMQINNMFDRIHFISDFSSNDTYWIDKNKSFIDTPGTDLDVLKPGKKEDFVLFVGRLSRQKGIHNLIEAARIVPNIKFKIVGDGEERAVIEKNLPANVELLGRVSQKTKINLYSRASIFVAPSVGEGLGMVVQEAMAAGCAVVSSIPIDFRGVHLENIEPPNIASAINYMIGDMEKTREMGTENHKLASRWTWDSYIDVLEKEYRRVIGSIKV